MLALLTMILSNFGGGIAAGGVHFIQSLLNAGQDKRDKAHELAMYQYQLESQKIAMQGTVEAAKAEADASWAQSVSASIDNAIKSDNWLVAFLNGMIRPVTTIAYTSFFFYLMYVVYDYATTIEHLTPVQIIALPIYAEFLFLVKQITEFWFVIRQLSK